MQNTKVIAKIMHSKSATTTLHVGNGAKVTAPTSKVRALICNYRTDFERSPRVFVALYQRDLNWVTKASKPNVYALLSKEQQRELAETKCSLAARTTLLP